MELEATFDRPVGRLFRRAYDAFGHVIGGEEYVGRQDLHRAAGHVRRQGNIAVDTGESRDRFAERERQADTAVGIVAAARLPPKVLSR